MSFASAPPGAPLAGPIPADADRFRISQGAFGAEFDRGRLLGAETDPISLTTHVHPNVFATRDRNRVPAEITITPLDAHGAEITVIRGGDSVWLPVGRHRFTAIGEDGALRTVERAFGAGDGKNVTIEFDD